jgi:hypothetical protein
MLAALFGDDNKNNTTQLADAGNVIAPAPIAPTQTQKIELAQTATAEPVVAALQIPTGSDRETPPAAALQTDTAKILASAPDPAPPTNQDTSSVPSTSPPGSARANLSKLPFGGVMAPVKNQSQDMAIALSAASPGMRLGHTIYTNRLMNGPHPLPPMLSSGAAAPAQNPNTPVVVPAPTVPVTTSMDLTTSPMNAALAGESPAPTPYKNPLPPELAQDMMLKALSQYRSTAAGPQNAGNAINLIN